jgi:hypothetical protein
LRNTIQRIKIISSTQSRRGIQVVVPGSRGRGRLQGFVISQFGTQKVNFAPEQNGETRKIKPQVQADGSA